LALDTYAHVYAYCVLLEVPEEASDFDLFACDTKDHILRSGLGHVFPGSDSLYATAVAAYVFFGSTLYFIYQEFKWFTRRRHSFLKKREPANYTVYVSNIPKSYRVDNKLSEYLGTIFSRDEVMETHMALDIPGILFYHDLNAFAFSLRRTIYYVFFINHRRTRKADNTT
jgi:hypothetical protein